MAGAKEHVKIKLNDSRANRARGFYFLMINGNTYSNKKNEFIIERKFLKLLKKKKIKHEIVK